MQLHILSIQCIDVWCTAEHRRNFEYASFAWWKTLNCCLLISLMEFLFASDNCGCRWYHTMPQSTNSDPRPRPFAHLSVFIYCKINDEKIDWDWIQKILRLLQTDSAVRTETMSPTFINRVRWIISIAFNLAHRNNVYGYLSCAFFFRVGVFSPLEYIGVYLIDSTQRDDQKYWNDRLEFDALSMNGISLVL